MYLLGFMIVNYFITTIITFTQPQINKNENRGMKN